MSDGSDWVMRPVLRGMVTYERLLDGSLTIIDLGRMNEALDVSDENQRRLSKED